MVLKKLLLNLWFLVKRACGKPFKSKLLYYETYKIILGTLKYKKLRRIVGQTTHIIFFRGATGDTYFQFLLLNEYLKENKIKNFVVAGDSANLMALADIFRCSNVFFVPYLEYIEKAYLFYNGKNMNVLFPFCWADNFYFNKCRIRMTEKFNFMDTYRYFAFKLKNSVFDYRKFNFNKTNETSIFSWESQGIIKDRTILIAPDANSVTKLPIWFWNGIIKELQAFGYTVFMNCFYPTFFRAPNLFTSYKSAVPMLEYAGAFIGVRSGFCDIISSAKCKKIILYPKIQDELNLDKHRSEVEYSGLTVMGLYQGEDLKEISTPLLRNITDKEYMLSGTDDYFNAIETLRKQIMENFKEVQNVSITNQSS